MSSVTKIKTLFKSKSFRIIGIGCIVIMGQIYPILFHYRYHSELVTALNLTPHNTVFAYYPFFSDIEVVLKYSDHEEKKNSVELYEASNLYSGKYVYSIFYMSYIYKRPTIRDAVTRWYFCNKKNFNSRIDYKENLEKIGITYVHRRTHEVAERREVYCDNHSPKPPLRF